MKGISFKKYVDLKIKCLDEKIDTHVKYTQDAVATAKTENDRRLEGMNEFRAQLEKQAITFVTTDVFQAQSRLVTERTRWNIGTIISIIALIFSAITLITVLFRILR